MSGKVFYFEPNRLPIGFEIPPHKEECGPHLCVPTLDGNVHVIPTTVIEKAKEGYCRRIIDGMDRSKDRVTALDDTSGQCCNEGDIRNE